MKRNRLRNLLALCLFATALPTDGYWLMIAPLSKGTHDIRVHVRAPGTIFGLIEFELIYHITVQ